VEKNKTYIISKTLFNTVNDMDFIIEMKCPVHGFERFRIKVIRKYNMPSCHIEPKFVSRPKKGEIRRILVGRAVEEGEIREFLDGYFRHKRMSHLILGMRVVGR